MKQILGVDGCMDNQLFRVVWESTVVFCIDQNKVSYCERTPIAFKEIEWLEESDLDQALRILNETDQNYRWAHG